MFRALVHHASDLIMVLEVDGVVRYVNPAIERWLGYKPEELISKNVFGYINSDDNERVTAAFDGLVNRSETKPPIELRMRHRDGSFRTLETMGTNLLEDSHVRGIVINAWDVTERKQGEEKLRKSEERFRSAFEDASTGVALVSLDNHYLRVNRALCEILGYEEEEILQKSSIEVTYSEDLEVSRERTARMLEDGGPRKMSLEKRYVRKDGSVAWAISDVSLVRDSDGNPSHFVTQLQDITRRKLLEEELAYQAFHDSLTGLPNRALLMDRLGRALSRTRRQTEQVAVLFMDLDDFKVVNDSLGHEVGDRLLVMVAGRLSGCLRPQDTLARLGGDEFVVLLEDDAGIEEAIRVARRILGELQTPFTLQGRQRFVSASIGMAADGLVPSQPGDLIKEADLAMYRAKEKGKAGYALFERDMEVRAMDRLDLEEDLREAIERGGDELCLFYQPIVRLQNGQIAGMEALLRWGHPERGMLAPERFVPIAETSGLIAPLGRWVLGEACRQAREWQELLPSGQPPVVVCVNLSAGQFKSPLLVEEVTYALKKSELDAGTLGLEVPEGAAMEEPSSTITKLGDLKKLGVKLTIDDFGTGYSSLSYLPRFPVDSLKIDRSLVSGTGQYGPEEEVVVSGIVGLAHGLGLEVVAEGVESEERLAWLKEMGCELAQGYCWWEPLEAGDASALLGPGFGSMTFHAN